MRMATPTELLLVSSLLLFAGVANGRISCPRRSEVENCTAVHKATFSNILISHGSLLGGVEIADLHNLCDSYTKAVRCIHRLESECSTKNATTRLKTFPLYNISSLCPNRGSSTIETYSLHHRTCFLKPDVKKEITECWNHFETTVGHGNKLTPKSLLYSSKKRIIQQAASLRSADSAERQNITTAVCKLHACLEDAIDARCYPGANFLMSSLALPLPPFSLQQYSTNCTLHLQSSKENVSEQQDVKKRTLEKQLSTQSPDLESAGRPRKVNRQAITASGRLSSVGMPTSRSAWWLTLMCACGVLILAKWL